MVTDITIEYASKERYDCADFHRFQVVPPKRMAEIGFVRKFFHAQNTKGKPPAIVLLESGDGGEAKALEPEEITEWNWFGLDKLPEPLFFPSKKILENYLRKEYYIEK